MITIGKTGKKPGRRIMGEKRLSQSGHLHCGISPAGERRFRGDYYPPFCFDNKMGNLEAFSFKNCYLSGNCGGMLADLPVRSGRLDRIRDTSFFYGDPL